MIDAKKWLAYEDESSISNVSLMFGANWPIEATVPNDLSESAIQNFERGLVSADEYKISLREVPLQGPDEFTDSGLAWSVGSDGVWYAKD
jgi:hypothetical protein